MIKGIIFDFNRTLYNPELCLLVNGTLEVLDDLTEQEMQLCLISKKSSEDRREQISNLGLDKYFKDIQVIKGEKKEEHLQYCLDIMGLSPEEVAVVGDRVRCEIGLGNRLGMTTIWFQRGVYGNEPPTNQYEKPNYRIKKLEQVLEIVKT